MKVLVVWEEIPDFTKMFIIDVSVEDFERVARCNGHYINSVDSDCVQDDLEYLNDRLDHEVATKIEDGKQIPIEEVKFVVHTGFIL